VEFTSWRRVDLGCLRGIDGTGDGTASVPEDLPNTVYPTKPV
jgi:hypothetical protein